METTTPEKMVIFGIKPSKKSKVDYGDQIFGVISLTGHMTPEKLIETL